MGVEGGEAFPESQHMACCLLRLAFFPLFAGNVEENSEETFFPALCLLGLAL